MRETVENVSPISAVIQGKSPFEGSVENFEGFIDGSWSFLLEIELNFFPLLLDVLDKFSVIPDCILDSILIVNLSLDYIENILNSYDRNSVVIGDLSNRPDVVLRFFLLLSVECVGEYFDWPEIEFFGKFCENFLAVTGLLESFFAEPLKIHWLFLSSEEKFAVLHIEIDLKQICYFFGDVPFVLFGLLLLDGVDSAVSDTSGDGFDD